jgi:hypothetical protein
MLRNPNTGSDPFLAKVAATLGVSVVTVEQHWRLAQVWLAGQLRGRDR